MFEAIDRIDFHTHIFYGRPYLEPLMAQWRLTCGIINITGRKVFAEPMDRRWRAMRALKEQHPEKFFLCTTFDPEQIEEPDFAHNTIAQLRQHLEEGAVLVKVWKDIGLDLRDATGEHVMIDDPRFRPIWDFLARQNIPVLAHIAEPRAAWLPLDASSPHFAYYRAHPEYHLYHDEDAPAWEHLVEARDRWVEQNPDLTIIGAHLGSTEHDVALVAERIERFPNFYVDTAERFGDLVTQSSDRVRAFFLRHHERILYGTDVIVDRPADVVPPEAQDQERASYDTLLETHWKYLSGTEPVRIADKLLEPIQVEPLGLPRDVLENVYARNARRILSI